MKMDKKLSIILYCLLINNVTSSGEFGPQPRITSSSEHLIINSAENRDIHFVTKGTGKIKLNDGDLTDATNLARNATEALNKINSEYYDTVVQVQRLKRSLEGSRGALMRIANLENGHHNSNGSTDQQPEYISSVLNRRMRILGRKVNRLINLLRKNECNDNPCQNGGTCQDMFNGYLCRCPTEWEGANCDRDVNECARFAGTDLGCQNGATCVNKPGTYECVCKTGWFGIHCIQQSASCSNGSAEELCGHGYCIPQGHSYTCLCHEGWTKEGTNPACNKDVDECALATRPACSIDPPVTCINVPGSFYCGNCPAGYSGVGYCTDINECELFNGGCSVNPMVHCINTPGSRVCGSCPAGYVGDGISCTFQGVCGVNNGGCHPFAQCRDNPRISATYVECTCQPGYFGSGIGSSGCTRDQNLNPCDSNPCLHGTCVARLLTGTYTCHCNQEFTGTNCDIRKNFCQPNPCLHGGSCSDVSGLSYICYCTNGYTGTNCEEERQACGGHLREFTGVLKYPSTSSIISAGRTNCVWIILTNNTKVLNITFTEFHFEDSPNCRSSWLEIHDGRNSAANSLGRFCGSTFPNGGMLTSTHNAFYIWIRTQTTSNTGFSLNWTTVDPVCGGMLPFESHGILNSPGFPENYPLNRDCYWYLSAPNGKRIQFHFFTLEIGSNPNCSSDFVKVYEGESTSQLLAQYCNTSQPEPLVSSGPNAVVYFHSDSSNSFPGFQVAYSSLEGIQGCGGIYTGNTGSLSSPIIHGEYLPNLNCEYKISSVENSRIKITFESFDLESETSCYYDYVEIYEGTTTQAPSVGRYCGKNLPGPYTSVGNHILIVFNTDYSNGGAGFLLKYERICGGVYSEPSGVITSPGYPESYKLDQICIYEILQPLGRSITLEFFDFDIESSYSSDCIFDFVEIHDGASENSTLVGKYCEQRPPIIQSTYNILWVKFQSDSSVSEKGFTANYTTTDMGCGGILRNKSGTFETPREGGSYPESSNCTWIIVAPPSFIIELSWSSFELESTSSCSFDYVEIFGNYSNNEKVAKYCGSTLPPTLTSSSNVLTVKFISDISVNYDGFVANYVFVDERTVCGGRFHGSSGVIKSPSFPSTYPLDRECTWIIGTENGQQIMLNVLNFTLESSTECRFDYVEIRNGASRLSPLIGKYCGRSIPKEIPSHTNYLYIFFRSDISLPESGFRFSWDATATGCGGILTSPTGTLESPNYPEPYSENTNCKWRISVNAGSRIQLNMTDINLETHYICGIDYVEIFDGANEQSPSLGKFCNEDETKSITSTSNHLTIKFHSDISIQKRGFSFEYSTICQNTIEGFRGVIESPNYPNKPREQNCDWKIEVPMGNKINLTFTSFDISNYDNPTEDACSPDYLKIEYSDPELDMITLGTYCNSKRPSLLTVNSNIAKIIFKSNEYQEGTGFRFEWQIEGCGGLLTRPNGTLKTPNYPNGYPMGTQCDWIIRSDYGLSIAITFMAIDFEISYDCMFDYIMITNGPNESYPLLSHVCSKGTKPTVVTSSGNEVFVRFKSDGSYKGKGFIANYTSLPTKCGGKLSGISGSFTSPNYPKNYDSKDRCEWLIEVEDGHVIDLEFDEFSLSGDCTDNYVSVYDGPSSDSALLSKLCDTLSRNTTVRSTSNVILVVMSTRNFYPARGFSATYYMACGGFITTNDTGIIRFSDSSYSVRDVSNCSWYIVASDASQHIWLTISHIHIRDENGKIEIYNGDSKEAPLALTLTEDKLPPPFTSVGNALHIQLIGYAMDFIATYSVLDSLCGGVLARDNGYFATPNYPNPYPIEIQCEWTIPVAPGNQISMSFNNFELVSSENCHMDYLEIRETNGTGKLLGTFCDAMPTNITQVGSLWLLFQSSKIPGDDSGATAKGFLAEYSYNRAIDLSGPTGQIASPLYPDIYLKSDTFAWRVTVSYSKIISITFKDFNVEFDYDSECYLSQLEIFDGPDDDSPRLAQLCGADLPNPIKTSSSAVYIKMLYDTVRQGSKFLIEWSEMDYETINPAVRKPAGCGSNGTIEVLNSTSYNLTSPGYPYGYKENLDCEWIFSTAPEFHFTVNFVKIDLENVIEECVMDNIQIYTGIEGTEDWKLVQTACTPNRTLFRKSIAAGNLMKVIFHTDSYGNGTGFQALVRRNGGGSLQGLSNGVIQVNSSENVYPSCQWNVTVRPGRTIRVAFEELNLMNQIKDSPCHNYVLLKNGIYPDSPLLGNGKYCNDTIPEPLVTTGNYLYIYFYGSRPSNFSLTYEEISQDCGETITLSAFHNVTHISSPNYPNIPPPYSECIWTVIAPPGESLRLDFEERFDVTKTKNCEKAGVEIRDGGSKYSSILQTYCATLPNSTFSSDNMMTIRFYTNIANPKNGFKAVITIATCGGTIRSNYAELHSPNFNIKSKYPQNSNCGWNLIGPPGHYLIINFNTLDLGFSSECYDDYVTIQEIFNMNGTVNNVGKYCGTDLPGEIRIASNEAFVNFVSSSYTTDSKGFSLYFNASQEECGGKLNMESGFIQSPSYPQSLLGERECEWSIIVPEGRRVSLEFLDLDLLETTGRGQIYISNEPGYNSFLANLPDANHTTLVKSTGNTMQIFFWSLHPSSHRGFRAQFTSNEPTICQGNFNHSSGIIASINETAYFCTWKHYRNINENQTLSMVISISNSSERCRSPPRTLVISADNAEDVIVRLCETLPHPVIVRSPYIVTHITVNKLEPEHPLQYSINYTTHPCGGIILNEEGDVTTPGFPNKYSGTIECAWLIKLPSDQKVKVNFTTVNLDENCDYNYISIYNGEFRTKPKIGQFCQNNKPSLIISQSNILLVEYHADEKSSGTGFKFHYEPVMGGCSGIFHDRSRIIETPSYPNNYPNNSECNWEVIASDGYHVVFEFIDRFYIEESENCKNDFVELWDYVDDQYKSAGKFCGRNLPQKYNSTSNRMKILFRSNEKIRATGFKAKWTFECGGIFEATEKMQYIVSPGYPNAYRNKLECSYNISSVGNYIDLVFEDFNIEFDPVCAYDNVTIKRPVYFQDLYYYDANVPIRSYCGQDKPAPLHVRDEIIIRFATDPWIVKKGFKFSYSIEKCGGLITEPSLIGSPTSEINGVQSYNHNIKCFWNITAPNSKTVVVRFTQLNIEYNDDCRHDFVEVYDGTSFNESTRLAKLCGNLTSNPPVIKSKSNSMILYMESDYSVAFEGFKAEVFFTFGPSVNCGGIIIVNDTATIEAPSGYSHLECHWEITTQKDNILKFHINEVHLLACTESRSVTFGKQTCGCDILEFRDGGASVSELITRLCDNSLQPDFTTSSHSAWIRLNTFQSSTVKSFKVTVEKVPSICGPSSLNVTNETQVLTSPLYPNAYPDNIRCNWLLKSDGYADTIDLHFTDFDLVNVTDQEFLRETCTGDRVEISDQNKKIISEGLGTATIFAGSSRPEVYTLSPAPIGIHPYCGRNALDFDYYSGRNQAIVSFISGMGRSHGKGFRMEYRIAGCNRNYTSVQGRIKNSNFFGNCDILIIVPPNNTISLYFMTFMMYDTSECPNNGMQIYDGDSKSDTLMATICGYETPSAINSQSNKLFIHLYNNVATPSLYDIVYTTTNQGKGCGGIFYNYIGKFTSPLHPGAYRKEKTCTWEITVPQGMQIVLKFSDFDVGGECTDNYVDVKTFHQDNSDSTNHHFCSSDNPAVLRSENNHMSVSYTTTVNNGGSGWVAHFMAVNAGANVKWDY